MGSPSSELSLECKPATYSMLLKSFRGDHINNQSSSHHDHHHDHHEHNNNNSNSQKLEDFLSRLEEERLKIDAFKRELPLCMQLLTNAVEASKQQLQAYKANIQAGSKPVLEEFIPLKLQSNSELLTSEKLSNISDKATWMTSAQLWSQTNDTTKQSPNSSSVSSKEQDIIGFNVTPKLGISDTTKQRINGGAFLPFSKDRINSNSNNNKNNSTLRDHLPDLTLASAEKEMDHHEDSHRVNCSDVMEINKVGNSGGMAMNMEKAGIKGNNGNIQLDSQLVTSSPTTGNNSNGTSTSQTHRKARRCWSPDLHRRFVNALQMLGGSQVATPKQIRELMKVDGLTNDEVKSHLQKYRLHTRRPSPSPNATGAPTPQLVVLGGIWVPQEYATAAHGGAAIYSPHPTSHAPPHFCAPAVPQDFYTAQPPQAALHHHALHPQAIHMYNATSPTNNSSPESDMRGNGDRSESIEDGKSESNSWKAESGENNGGGERKGSTLALP